jgi:hypothetical protein
MLDEPDAKGSLDEGCATLTQAAIQNRLQPACAHTAMRSLAARWLSRLNMSTA